MVIAQLNRQLAGDLPQSGLEFDGGIQFVTTPSIRYDGTRTDCPDLRQKHQRRVYRFEKSKRTRSRQDRPNREFPRKGSVPTSQLTAFTRTQIASRFPLPKAVKSPHDKYAFEPQR